jgi:hypothetical protein
MLKNSIRLQPETNFQLWKFRGECGHRQMNIVTLVWYFTDFQILLVLTAGWNHCAEIFSKPNHHNRIAIGKALAIAAS